MPNNSIKNHEYHWFQKLSFSYVICRREYNAYRVYRAWNGILLFLTLQASIYVNAHHIDFGLVLCKKELYGFHYFKYAATLALKKSFILYICISYHFDQNKNLFNDPAIEIFIISLKK